jgi:integrase
MARKPSPWYWPERNGWFTILNGQRQPLGNHPADAPPPQKRKGKWVIPTAIDNAFHKLLSTPATAPPLPAQTRDGLSVAEVFDKFLDWCQKHREGRTYADYHDYIQKFLDHLKEKATMPVAGLRPFHIVEFVDSHKGWNDTTRRKSMIHLQRPFNWAAKLGYIPDNPVRHIEKPQAKRRDNPVTPEDFALLLGKVKEGDPFRDLLEFNWHAGVRPQEARHFEPRHVHLEEECIIIPAEEAKGKKRPRVIHLHGRSLEIIIRLMHTHASGKLFRNADGDPWKPFAICNRFRRLSIAVAIDILKEKGIAIPTLPRFEPRHFADKGKVLAARKQHQKAMVQRDKEIARLAREHGKGLAAYDLRHGFANRKLLQGHDHLTVAELLGHKDGAMLARVYQHLHRNPEHLKKVLAD